jgi:hypothetical protein
VVGIFLGNHLKLKSFHLLILLQQSFIFFIIALKGEILWGRMHLMFNDSFLMMDDDKAHCKSCLSYVIVCHLTHEYLPQLLIYEKYTERSQ